MIEAKVLTLVVPRSIPFRVMDSVCVIVRVAAVIVEAMAGLYLLALVVKTTDFRIRLDPDMSTTVQGLVW